MGTGCIFVIGYPSSYGGADTELWHVLHLFRAMGREVRLVPTWSAASPWRERCDAIGVSTIEVGDAEGFARVPDLAGSTVLSFCNGQFLRHARVFRELGCRVVWIGCMTWVFTAECQHYKECGPFDAYVFQSEYQRSRLFPELEPFGVREEQCFLIRGAFSADEFPFSPLPHEADSDFVLGRLARADLDKWSGNTWNILSAVPYARRHARLMGWDDRLKEKLGAPPEWAEVLAPCAEPAREFLAKLHCLVSVNGGAAENWPRVGLEAMSAGVPVIAENQWGWREMIVHGKTGFLANNDHEFSYYAAYLAMNEDARQKIIKNARSRLVEDLANPEVLSAQWQNLLEYVESRPPGYSKPSDNGEPPQSASAEDSPLPVDWWNEHGTAKRAQFLGWVGGPDALSRRAARQRIIDAGYRSLVDCGCGLGQEFDGYREAGYQIDYRGIDTCRSFVADCVARGLNVSEASVEAIPVPDASTDVVYARHVLEHLGKPTPALLEMMRVARREVMIVYFIHPALAARKWIADVDGVPVMHHAISIAELGETAQRSPRFRGAQWEAIGSEMLLRVFLDEKPSGADGAIETSVATAWTNCHVGRPKEPAASLARTYRRRARLVIGVLSAADHEARRAACRATWISQKPADVEVVFLIGGEAGSAPRQQGDVLRLPCPDDYSCLPQKTRWFCAWALANFNFDRLMKCDDDTYVEIGRLLDARLYGDYVGHDLRSYASGGAGYVLSARATATVADHLHDTQGCEDVLVGRTLAEHGIEPVHDPRFQPWKGQWPTPDNDQITGHYCSPEILETIHSALASDQGAAKAQTIPRTFHHVWLGGKPLPAEFQQYRETWIAQHPRWEFHLWTEENLPALQNREAFDRVPTLSQKSDVARYELLYRYGGVYLDTDFECLRPIDALLREVRAFAAEEDDTTVAVGILGAEPENPLLTAVIADLPASVARGGNACTTTGPGLFTRHARNDQTFCIFDRRFFYPKHYTGTLWGPLSDAYAVHHWAHSWK